MKDYSFISRNFHNYESEKRQQKRVEFSGVTDYYYLNGNKKTGNIQIFDINISGLGLLSQDSFVLNDVLEFTIDIPGYISMQIMCYINRKGHIDDGFIYGTTFVSMNNLNRDIIKMFIDGK